MTRARTAAIALAVMLAPALVLPGCSAVPDRLADAAAQASAAASGASLAVRLQEQGRAAEPATDTTLQDALRELTDASDSVTQIEPGQDAAARARTLAAIRAGTDAVIAAREALAEGRPGDPEALRDAADALSALDRELGGS